MRILGIDPGTAITGWGFINQTDPNTFIDIQYGSITTPAKQPLPARLETIFDQVNQLIDELNPDAFSIESLFFNTNAKTAMSVGHARGVAVLAAVKQGLPVTDYTPLQIKTAITGYGRADKRQMQLMVKTILNLPEVPKPDDAADGLAAALTHAFTAKSNFA